MYSLSPEAEQDIRGIIDYTLGEWGASQVDRYLDNLYKGMENIIFPRAGNKRFELAPDLYVMPVEKHLVYYLPVPGGIYVIRIPGSGQEPGPS